MTVSLSWPSQLPLPRLESHLFRPRPPLIRTEIERGAIEQRRRFESVPQEVPFSVVLDRQQMAIWNAWTEHKAQARWFGMPLLADVMPLVTHDARIIGLEEEKELTPSKWMVTGTIEVRDRAVLTEDMLQIFIDEEMDLDLFNEFHILVHFEIGQ